jgi:hypothetical protein
MPPAKKATAKKATAKKATAKKATAKKTTATKTTARTSTSAATKAKATRSPSSLIDERIDDLGDWRSDVLAKVRALIHQAVPDVVEDWKWRGVPTWEHEGIITTGESYKEYVKFTFPKGASLSDPAGLFNSSLEGNARRAIDVHQGDKVDVKAWKALVKAAADLNASKKKKK